LGKGEQLISAAGYIFPEFQTTTAEHKAVKEHVLCQSPFSTMY